jgi:Cu-Zn family superoxide dismutase
MKILRIIIASSITLTLGACATGEEGAKGADSPVPALEARALLSAGKPANKKVAGDVGFSEQSSGGVRVRAVIRGLKPGSKHGFHVHEGTECQGPGFESAGGHFNPGKHDHGSPETEQRHAGDLGNVTADAQGVATLDQVFMGITLRQGVSSIVGKALILHEGADDLKTQPTGNAGPRLACALVGLDYTSAR